jgi:phosphatidylserine/phosphatidylglycerophosphate/cardiolipin synthase-like enzyme
VTGASICRSRVATVEFRRSNFWERHCRCTGIALAHSGRPEIRVKLIVQPRDGLTAFLNAIRLAKKELNLVVFRFDRPEIEKALEAAVKRGVRVHTLIAHTNRGGEKNLRKLEQKLLEAGATVARTGDDFIRYHGKLMIVDRSTLWLVGFNFTALDISRSRSFGIVTKQKAVVQEALKLFEADAARQPHEPAGTGLVISPENARPTLSEFLGQARQQLLIYDPKVSDRAMIKLLKDRVKAGVDVRIIGKVNKGASDLVHERYPGKRLHVRAIVRDRREAFVGSQSLRKLELDDRREVGLIVKDSKIVAELAKIFEEDWALTDTGKKDKREESSQAGQREARAAV